MHRLRFYRNLTPLGVSLVLLIFMTVGAAIAAPSEITKRLRAAEPIGEASFRLLGAELYRAQLFTEGGADFEVDQPYSLALVYERSIKGSTLIKATLREMRRMEGKRADHAEIAEKLNDCFQSVKEGDRYSAIPRGQSVVEFWRNGALRCSLSHPGIRDRIMGIWLSDQSRDPNLSRQLRGQS
ncbi:MAG: hypothetical protein ABJO27_04025 [Pseudoruegeria sp.]